MVLALCFYQEFLSAEDHLFYLGQLSGGFKYYLITSERKNLIKDRFPLAKTGIPETNYPCTWENKLYAFAIE